MSSDSTEQLMVEHAVELSLAELQQRFVPREVTATLQCAGNRRAGLITYRDIPGRHPGERARPPRRAGAGHA